MKLAIFALTLGGFELSRNLANSMPEYQLDIYISSSLAEKLNSRKLALPNSRAKLIISEGSLREELALQIEKYDGFIMIMALGIIVRLIAPYVKDKRNDPAVVCLDEKGQFAISVLSGHLGGANELTEVISRRVNAIPVITTATDVNQTISFDLIAEKYNLGIEPFNNLKYFNGAMVNKEKVIIYSDMELPKELRDELQEHNLPIKPLEQFNESDLNNFCCIISENIVNSKSSNNQIFLRPRNLIIGVGCRKHTETELVVNAIKQGMAKINKSTAAIKKIVSVDIKKEEKGILEAAKHFGVPVQFFSAIRLQETIASGSLAKSDFVHQNIGVEGVCEPAAILGGTNPQLILRKTIFPKTTIAVAKEKFMW